MTGQSSVCCRSVIVKVHEQVGTRVRDDVFGLPTGWRRLAWPAISFPLLARVFVLLWRLARDFPPRAGLWIRSGLGLLAAWILIASALTGTLLLRARSES